MSMNKYLVILVIVVAVAGVGLFGLWAYQLDQGVAQPNGLSNDSVPIQDDFGSKIVYTIETSRATQPFIDDCQARGGDFNSCGNICSPDAAACASVCAYTCELDQNEDGQDEIDTSNWQSYENQQFGFSLRYPQDDWKQYEDTSFEFSPKFNFYPAVGEEIAEPPFDHFANVNHVSVYPQGVPTEGLTAQSRPLEMELPFAVSQDSRVFVMEDGTPFAAVIRPLDIPLVGWLESGFIYSRLHIDNLETRCLRDGQEVSQDQCDPLAEGGEIVWSGSVNEDLWPVLQEVIRNFEFLPSATSVKDLIRLDQPTRNAAVASPLTVTGEARGAWYFEGVFPVVLTDWDGRIIAEANAHAQGEWMTEDFVPFEAVLNFDISSNRVRDNGSLILQRSNPSGLPENDAALEIPVLFE